MNSIGKLLSRHLQNLPPGEVNWIGLRPQRKASMLVVQQALATEGLGLKGDRRYTSSPGSARQVTFINQEHIDLIAKILSRDIIDPSILRRNVVISGINLVALRHQRFQIGEAIFETNSHCHPCLRMEQALGKGAVAAMLGHGGVCAKVIRSGIIKTGDQVFKLDEQMSLSF